MSNQSLSELNVMGYFLSSIGLGQAARNIAYALETTNIQATFIDIYVEGLSNPNEFSGKCGGYYPNLNNLTVCGIDLLSQLPHIFQNAGGLGKNNFLYPFWELDRIPYYYHKELILYDEIFASSQFSAEAFSNFLGKEIVNIPKPVEIPATSETNYLRGDKLVIFSLLDFASWVERKNPLGVLDAFQLAFPPTFTDVELIVKVRGAVSTYGQDDTRTTIEKYSKHDSRIKIIDQTFDRIQVDELISQCNVYLSMHRSEAMARGKIVIATDYGGTTDFVNHSTGFPVAYKVVPVKPGEYCGGDNQLWADPLLDSAASCLRDVYEHYDLALQKAINGRDWLIKNNSFPVVGRLLESTLRSKGYI